MLIRKWTLFFLALILLSGGACPSYAQKNLPKLFKQWWPSKKIDLTTLSPQKVLIPNIRWEQLDAIAFSQLSTNRTVMAAVPLFMDNPSIKALRPLQPAPDPIKRAVFTLQHNPQTHGKGSAFAVAIDGEVWGVTARHVLDDIGRSPYLSVKDAGGKELFFQVQSVREGNVRGADIAIFRIPQEALAYIKPLKPNYQLPKAHETVQSAGFSHGIFGWFPQIDVLFASGHRILARYENFPVRSGYCGSPLIKNGAVIGVFVGITPADMAKTAAWYGLLSDSFENQSIHAFTQIVPLSWVRSLVRQEKSSGKIQEGMPLKLLGKTLALLKPDENIQSIQQIRNGILIKNINAYPFMDYNHLEAFFEIQPQDKLLITVQQGDRSSSRKRLFVYELETSSGHITRNERKF